MVFNMKKLLNDSVEPDATTQEQNEAMQANDWQVLQI
jgi:hypothetical protein